VGVDCCGGCGVLRPPSRASLLPGALWHHGIYLVVSGKRGCGTEVLASAQSSFLEQGGSSLVRVDFPYIPCAIDRAAISSVLLEAYCTVVIYAIYLVWALVLGFSILAMLILFNHHLVTLFVFVGSAFGILPVVVLNN
jgi:hypothetical protein